MGKKQRLRRDVAGVGPEPRRSGLHPLSGLKEFRISKGEPDIRGWDVSTLNGREVGRVDDLLVDTDAGEVVMMDVAMRGSDRHVELPIRSAQIDQQRNRVIVDSGDLELFAHGSSDDARTQGDRDDRSFIGRDSDMVTDHDADDRARHARERARDEADESAERHTWLRGRDADAIERDQLPPEARSDTDEVVVERRPVIEEVVIRRRVVDSE